MAQLLNKHGLVDIRGPETGYCNICGSLGRLTRDHVPPKGTLGVPQVDLMHIVELLGAERPIGRKKARLMQSGVHFRSLCYSCNTVLLGTSYDPGLISFSNSVSQFLRTAVAVPDVASIKIVPGQVARCVIGHLFALGIERRERTPLLDCAVEFFMDPTLPLPDGLDVYYWVYPYRRQIAIRDGMLLHDFCKSPPIVFWCLKYFPLSFMVVWDNKPGRLRLPNLRDSMIHAGMHDAYVPLHLREYPSQFWPEAPTDSGAVFYGDGAVGALPRVG